MVIFVVGERIVNVTGLHSREMIKSTGEIVCSKATPWDFSRGYLQKLLFG